MSGIAVVSGRRVGMAGGFRATLGPFALVNTGKGCEQMPIRGPIGLDVLAAAAVKADAHLVYVVDRAHLCTSVREGGGWLLEDRGEGAGGEQWRYRLTREEDGRVVWVMLLELDDGHNGGPWHGLEPVDLVKAFAFFEKLTGSAWAESTGRTAEQLMLSTHPRSRGGVQLDSHEIPAEARGSSLEMPWTRWRRDLTTGEKGARFVHVFDANAQYLSAWITAELGHGKAEHRTRPHFDPKRPGVWRIPDAGKFPNMTPLLPAPWGDGKEWFSTPTVIRLLEHCNGLDLPVQMCTEAWVWPESSRWLRRAGEKLRDARTAARAERYTAAAALRGAQNDSEVTAAASRVAVAESVAEAVKLCYTTGTGRLGAELPGREGGSPWYRPDWGHTIRAQARVNLHRRLTKLGQAPIAIEIDALMFAAAEPDWKTFAERIRLPIGDALGQFRHVATLPVDDPASITFAGVRDYLRNRTMAGV